MKSIDVVEGRPSPLIPFARQLQLRLRDLFVDSGAEARNIRVTLAVDASYVDKYAFTCALMYDIRSGQIIRKWKMKTEVYFPYIPGYLFMREAPPIIKLLSRVDTDYDLLLIDAHGRLHPRRAGLATVVGILMKKPTIGIAKSLLVGSVEKRKGLSPVTLDGELLGYRIDMNKMSYYVSQGNMISLEESLRFLKRRGYEYPEELRLVDLETKKFRSGS
jgi:deoxyribonuclease V